MDNNSCCCRLFTNNTNFNFNMITKQIISYKLYKDNGNKVRVGKKNKLTIYVKGVKFPVLYKELTFSQQKEITPLIRFVEKDLQHNFNLIED